MTPEARLTESYLRGHAPEAARGLELLEAADAAALLAELPTDSIATALSHLVPYVGARVLEALPREQAGTVLGKLAAGQALPLLRSIEPTQRADLLRRIDKAKAAGLERALTYPAGTAGALADPFVLTLSAAASAAQALERIRREQHRTTYYLYVLEAGARLVGVTTLKLLLIADPDQSVGALCRRPVYSLSARLGLDALLESPHWRDFHVLPVVQDQHAFIGALHLRTLHAMRHATQTAGTETIGDTLMQLWELYAHAGLGLITGIANSLDAISEAASSHPDTHATGTSAGGEEVP